MCSKFNPEHFFFRGLIKYVSIDHNKTQCRYLWIGSFLITLFQHRDPYSSHLVMYWSSAHVFMISHPRREYIQFSICFRMQLKCLLPDESRSHRACWSLACWWVRCVQRSWLGSSLIPGGSSGAAQARGTSSMVVLLTYPQPLYFLSLTKHWLSLSIDSGFLKVQWVEESHFLMEAAF